jgi:soluble lytic murein transglycosylase-like protein
MAEEEFDETEKATLEIWRQRLEPEEELPANWRQGIYQGIVERLKVERPGLRSLPTSLVLKMIGVESEFNPQARGSAGEIGLMQLKPPDAEWVAKERKLGAIEDLADPRQNVLLGMNYLQMLSKQFGGLEQGVEAYNVGPTAYAKGKRNPNYVRKVLTRELR